MNAAQRNASQKNLRVPAPDPIDSGDDQAGLLGVASRNFTLDTLPFPATILRFSKHDGNTAWELVTFTTVDQVVEYITNTVGVYRHLTRQEGVGDHFVYGLADVPTPVLLAIYNSTRGDSPLARFRDRITAESRTAEVIMNLSVQWENTGMAKAKTAAAETGQTKTAAKAEEKAAAKAAKDAQKATEAAAKKAEREKTRGDGVIGTIKSFLELDNGGTQSEILDALVAKFPDRGRDGMSSTVKIQCSRLAKSTNRDIVSKDIQGRGRVYKFADRGAIPGVEVVKETKAAAAPAPVATAPASEAPASA